MRKREVRPFLFTGVHRYLLSLEYFAVEAHKIQSGALGSRLHCVVGSREGHHVGLLREDRSAVEFLVAVDERESGVRQHHYSHSVGCRGVAFVALEADSYAHSVVGHGIVLYPPQSLLFPGRQMAYHERFAGFFVFEGLRLDV